MIYTIEKVATLIGAHRYGTKKSSIGWLLTDSRSLCFPEETLFFAIKSERNDGHRYIHDLYRRGVRNFVVEKLPDGYVATCPDANFLKVTHTLDALQRLSERHRDEFDIPVVGITGSNGKTVVKEWLYQLLAPSMTVIRSPRSYNSQIGVPLSVWLMQENTEVGLFEAGISKQGEMQALRGIIQPTIGVLTNLGEAHQENFFSKEDKCREKLSLFHDAKVIVYPSDDDIISRCVRASGYKGEKIAWSMQDSRAAMYIEAVEKKELHTIVKYVFKGTEGCYTLPFIDNAAIENSITCAAVALYIGISEDDVEKRMANIEPVAMRLEVKEGQNGCTIINDSYNSDIYSLDIALDFMNRRPEQNGRKRTLILSDIYQSGMKPEKLYAEVSELIVKRGVDKFIGIGSDICSCSDIISLSTTCRDKACDKLSVQEEENAKEMYFFTDCQSFISSDVFRSLRDEVILIKGSRQFCFDKITDLLVKKVHETILEVNLNALVGNLNYFRSFMKPETKLVCMVKADGYGSGAVEVAKTLQDHRVDYLAVAVADEGVSLRNAGITCNIMIMNPEMNSFKTMFDYELEPEVYSFRLLDALVKAAQKEGITGYPVHIKLDTGMHRLGFNPEKDINELIDRLKHQTAIIPRSVFSHFVGSDSHDFDNFTKHQFDLFDKASTKLQSAFSHKILRHIDNSAGIINYPERQLDMCRLGIGLYGVDNRNNSIINNVCTLKTTILQTRNVPKEETVGYSRKGILTRDSVIAAIPIGYADGLDRLLGRGRCYCLVNGKKAPYVGNICMDVAMIDVTDIDCKEGDMVEIFGDNLPVTVLSDAMDTIPYEVLTGISNRVKRVYFQD